MQSNALILGFETSDDAAVYRLSDEMAALLTVDFFTPIVDDPYDFGRITAANSLSDIYAMGGKPLTAMNLLAFSCELGPEVVADVLRGGAEICAEAGVVVIGGHTIDDAEPKYGLSVMGTVHPEKVWLNRGAQHGDVLIMTKPLGTGVWGTALKRQMVTEDDAREVIEAMATLNKEAMEAAEGLEVHACTDITGFGLAGHLHEMASASGVDAEVALDVVPLHERVAEFASSDVVPGRTAEIISWAQDFITFDDMYADGEKAMWLNIVCDPQTSGGLLLALPRDDAGLYLQRMGNSAVAIGRCHTGDGALSFV
ncbi:MAG: selenide, water dikinase SelD [Coriobacteriia bacterium]|nr:selenide, water dikinase SelD [Coriobacteriia bacterium]